MVGPGHTLLIADADIGSRDALARRLERRGCVIVTAGSGAEVLEHLGAHPVSVVLMDLRLPGSSTLEMLQRIRETWTAAELPVLVLASEDQAEDAVTAVDLGANDVVARPIDPPLLWARIRTQLLRKEAEDRWRESEERFALAAAGANDGLWDWDLPAGQLSYSARWRAIVGHHEGELGAGPDEWFGRVHTEDLPRLHRDLDAHLAGRTPHFENEHRLRHATGAFRWVLTRGIAVRDRDGRPRRIAGSLSDITAAKVIDALTGLPNRMLLIDRLERVLQHHRLHAGGQFAVLFLDLDGFKAVNDNYGHLFGDEVLQAVARRLEASLRQSDSVARSAMDPIVGAMPTEHTLARLGGDEFVVLLHDVRDVVDATRVAERIQRLLVRPFDVGGREIATSASIGIAVGATSYSRPEDVLRDADTAMYRAKALGKGRSEVFDAEMRAQVIQRLDLECGLRLALERHEFLPYYQPIVDLQAGRLAGFEALLRWRHPTRGIVAPGEFVSVIEDNGLVVPVGRRFFADVSRQMRAWRDTWPYASRLSLNVNFAGQQVLETGLLDHLLEVLDDAGIEPETMVLEITESAVINDLARAAEVLRRVRQAGIRVILDNFGTGYSSLACLHELPVTGLKLDRAFVGREARHPAVLKAMVGLAGQLGLTVTAEGIETIEQCEALRGIGCHFGQGFLFARPLDAEAAASMIGQPPAWLVSAGVAQSDL